MSWLLKSIQFKLISAIPGGRRFYYFTQDHITKSSHASPLRVEQKINVGLDFWDWLKKENLTDKLVNGKILDMGSGWHPTIPLLWHVFGNNHQTLADINVNMSAGQVSEAVRIFRDIVQAPAWSHRADLKRVPAMPPADADAAVAALKPLGIHYKAPYGNHLKSCPEFFDIVTCTQALQHIPQDVQRHIFKELIHSMKPGGLFHGTIHFVGHFRSPWLNTGHYEHLSYSPSTWDNWINSSLMGFNRLKARDYRETLEQAGLRIREFKLTLPTPEDMVELKRTPIHPSFNRYTEEELATRGVFFVAEKP